MSRKKKSSKDKVSNSLKNDILKVFDENPNKQLNYKQVAGTLNISDNQARKIIYTLLNGMAREGILKETQKGKFKSSGGSKQIEGVLDVSRNGSGYVISDEVKDDIFVAEKNLGKALNGDRVVIELVKGRGRKPEGKVVQVKNQDQRLIVGTLDVQEHFSFLIPDDPKINVDLFISGSQIKTSESGYKAVARIIDWPDSAKNPFGKIVEILGKPESNEAEMKAILTAYGISYSFPEEVLREANQVSMELPEDEIARRRDFRKILTLTIDPVDAKDFDDALSIEFLDNGRTRIGIHIADVSHYVVEGSALDVEAKERGNSVYLVDRVIPMLPEHLSNGVCSLRPNEDKFAFSAVFELKADGEIKDEWFGKTVINSDRRFVYEEAQDIITSTANEQQYAKELRTLDQIAKELRKKRMAAGALEIHGAELRFELDNEGKPIEIFKKTSQDANKLVEEFMLLANRRVARFVGDVKKKNPSPLVYRVHDKPDMQKVEQFAVFASKFGKNFSYKNEMEIAQRMNKLFEEMKGETEFDMIQQMAIKSMSKAVYDTDNIGHFGLGFDYYAHFTSPIRRYADLIVHRILFNEIHKVKKQYPGLTATANHISITERRAVEAERASKKYFQALYLEDKEGEIFSGIITGLTDWGIYVELEENYCEGMISLKDMGNEHYQFDEKKYVIYGTKSGEEFNLGDRLKVRVLSVSLARKQIDLELIE
ncbi:MAG: ribonuclease R [Crocinitomicaceae bacterium]